MKKTLRYHPTRLSLLFFWAVAHCAAGLFAASAQEVARPTAPKVASGPQKIVKEGIEVEFTIDPLAPALNAPAALMAGRDSVVRFKVSDTATRTPLSGAKLAVWMSRRGAAATTDAQQCREKIQTYLQGSLRARPDVDLNAYYILALNQEANISVLDPLLGFGGSKLLTLVMLKGPGEDWVLTADREKLFVSMPLVNQVAVVDTKTWKVVANVDAGLKASRLALQPDGKYLWVGSAAVDAEGRGGVTVIDTADLKVVARVPTGSGHHDIVLSDDNRAAFVTNREDGTLSVVDAQKLTKIKDLKIGTDATSLAFSPLSKAVYVVDAAGGSIAVVNAREHRIVARVAAKPGMSSIRFAPGGRWGFAPNPAGDAVHVLDASTNQLTRDIAVGKGPDQVAFTEASAYVRAKGSEEVTVIRLSTIGKEPDTVKFPGGQNAPAAARAPASLADMMTPAPESNSMLLANPADKMIYYYTEGMAAPMGNFQNYRREPRGLMVVDRSLRESARGLYTANVRLPAEGVYDVALVLDSPRIVHCFAAEAAPNPEMKRDAQVALRLEHLNKEKRLRVGETFKLRFKLIDTVTGQPADGLQDVRVLTFLAPGVWQKRDFARPVAGGVYELDVVVPETGVYMIFVESQSRGVSYRQLPHLTLQAEAAAPPAK